MSSSSKIEQLKREQNPWEELPRLFAALRAGIGALAPADLNSRLRWWGLYTQGDGAGAFGGAAPYFMLRVRVPNGILTAVQAAEIAALAQRYGRGLVDVTVRQNIQLHWLDAETLPDVFLRLEKVGLTSQAACGDDPRNLTGCPLAGLDPDEFTDASPLLREVNRALLANGDYYNLPRKFKVCLTGCRSWCPNPEINDVAFTARPPDGDGQVWFDLRVGGGLSNSPHLALPLPVKVGASQVVTVACAVAGLFRDCDVLRQNRAQARLKFLFLRYGWTVERFRQEIESRLGFPLAGTVPMPPPAAGFRDHLGFHPQRQPGLAYAGISVLRGRMTADQLAALAEAAARWSASPQLQGEIRATAMQNVVLPHIPVAHREALTAFLDRWGLPLAASTFRRGVMSCTGKEFCKLAVTETKSFAADLTADLDRRLPLYPEPVRINLNGCPNSCGQHWIADIGLQGVRVKTERGPEDGYEVFLGGGLGADAALARKTLARVPAAQLAAHIEQLLTHYHATRRDQESFRAFVARGAHERKDEVPA